MNNMTNAEKIGQGILKAHNKVNANDAVVSKSICLMFENELKLKHSDAERLTKQIEEEVANFDALYARVSSAFDPVAKRDSIAELLQPVFDRIDKVPDPGKRVALYDQILYGLDISSDNIRGPFATTHASWLRGENPVYRDLMITPEYKLRLERSTDAIKNEILDRVANFNVSPQALKDIATFLGGRDLVAAFAKLGKTDSELKSFVAASLYVQNNGAAPLDRCVSIACTDTAVQKLEAAIRKGEMAKDIAEKTLVALIVTVMIVSFGLVLDAYLTALATTPVTSPVFTSLSYFPLPEVFAPFAEFQPAQTVAAAAVAKTGTFTLVGQSLLRSFETLGIAFLIVYGVQKVSEAIGNAVTRHYLKAFNVEQELFAQDKEENATTAIQAVTDLASNNTDEDQEDFGNENPTFVYT